MHPDVEAVLAVQAEDVVIHQLEGRLAELAPRLAAMQADIERAEKALAQARQAVEAEERRQRDVQGRVAQHRQLQERNQSQLNTITDARQATAAMAQLDQASKMIAEDERELQAIAARVADLRRAASDREMEIEELREAQAQARASLDADTAELRSQLDEKRKERAQKATKVPRSLLSRYERIAKRHVHAVVPLRGGSCTNCDTTIPLQRRSALVGTGVTEICEGCGVLLYATE